MSRTPAAVRSPGAEVITYGAPIFPGAMFMLARIGGVPVPGLSGSVTCRYPVCGFGKGA